MTSTRTPDELRSLQAAEAEAVLNAAGITALNLPGHDPIEGIIIPEGNDTEAVEIIAEAANLYVVYGTGWQVPYTPGETSDTLEELLTFVIDAPPPGETDGCAWKLHLDLTYPSGRRRVETLLLPTEAAFSEARALLETMFNGGDVEVLTEEPVFVRVPAGGRVVTALERCQVVRDMLREDGRTEYLPARAFGQLRGEVRARLAGRY